MCQPGSLAVKKWRENEKMKGKWRENEEMERKLRENEEMERKWRENGDMERFTLFISFQCNKKLRISALRK